jgi:hypothetical protein
MIRNSVINGMFREPGYTEVHEQINIDHSDFRERIETPGYTVSDTNLAIHDPETDSLYRGLYLRIVSLNSNN